MKTHEVLRQFFLRKKELNKQYSLRSLARDLEVSPSYVSDVLSGKKKASVKLIRSFEKILELDGMAKESLKVKLAQEILRKNHLEFSPPATPGDANAIDGRNSDGIDLIDSFKPLSRKSHSILKKWYNVALLDLMTCSNFKGEPAWIAKRLGLMMSEVLEALDVLERSELIEKDAKGNYRKKSSRVRIPTNQSREDIREFHRQMIEKSLVELKFKTEQASFDRRLISGITIAANPELLEQAKQRINEAIHQIASDLSQGQTSEVYQLNVQLFPLTKNLPKN